MEGCGTISGPGLRPAAASNRLGHPSHTRNSREQPGLWPVERSDFSCLRSPWSSSSDLASRARDRKGMVTMGLGPKMSTLADQLFFHVHDQLMPRCSSRPSSHRNRLATLSSLPEEVLLGPEVRPLRSPHPGRSEGSWSKSWQEEEKAWICLSSWGLSVWVCETKKHVSRARCTKSSQVRKG